MSHQEKVSGKTRRLCLLLIMLVHVQILVVLSETQPLQANFAIDLLGTRSCKFIPPPLGPWKRGRGITFLKMNHYKKGFPFFRAESTLFFFFFYTSCLHSEHTSTARFCRQYPALSSCGDASLCCLKIQVEHQLRVCLPLLFARVTVAARVSVYSRIFTTRLIEDISRASKHVQTARGGLHVGGFPFC